jgi:hypothetical protein
MTTEKLRLLLRRRSRAFVGATTVVAALWLLAVLAVDVLASPSTLADRDLHVPKGVVRLPAGVLKESGPKGGARIVFFRNPGGPPTDLAAWHTVVQCLILVTLAALVVAGLDRLRRKSRRSRRMRTV